MKTTTATNPQRQTLLVSLADELDDTKAFVGTITVGERWNGALVPGFEPDVALRVREYLERECELADVEPDLSTFTDDDGLTVFSGITWVQHVADDPLNPPTRVNPITGGTETRDERGDYVCEKHDLWLDPTEEGCGECYVEKRTGRSA